MIDRIMPRVICPTENTTSDLYEAIIKKHRPNISFETFVVGRKYDATVLAARGKLEKAGLYLWSFEEILQSARIRFEKILEILGQ